MGELPLPKKRPLAPQPSAASSDWGLEALDVSNFTDQTQDTLAQECMEEEEAEIDHTDQEDESHQTSHVVMLREADKAATLEASIPVAAKRGGQKESHHGGPSKEGSQAAE